MAKGNHRHLKKVKNANNFDRFMLVVSLTEPALGIPQIIRLYEVKNAISLSLTAWIFYVLTTIAWLIWGIRRNMKPIYIPQIAWLALEIIMIIGIIRYS